MADLRLDVDRRSDGAAGVASCGWTIQFLERRPAINFSVRDRVHRTTARKREIIERMPFMQRLKQGEERFLIGRLNRTRDVFVFLLERFVRWALRPEELDQCV